MICIKGWRRVFVVLGLLMAGALGTVWAEDHPQPVAQKWSFQGLGTFDRAQLQRGFQVYKTVCSVCHSLTQLRYRNLEALGFSPAEVKALAAEDKVKGLNDAGEEIEKPATPADPLPHPYPNEQAARMANNGALPPDLSLMVKARKFGPDYVYGILTGYTDPPPRCCDRGGTPL